MDDQFLTLLVEDNEDHAELIRRNFANFSIPNRLEHVIDGELALDYLFRQNQYRELEGSPYPNLILLDLRLPKVDGLAVLKAIKTSEELRLIPTVILTTSCAIQDVRVAYEHQANSYLTKPIEFDQFKLVMDALSTYWLGWNRHPQWTM